MGTAMLKCYGQKSPQKIIACPSWMVLRECVSTGPCCESDTLPVSVHPSQNWEVGSGEELRHRTPGKQNTTTSSKHPKDPQNKINN